MAWLWKGVWCFAAASMVLSLPWLAPAEAAPCTGATFIKSVADLQDINKNLAGKYCLANDLDLKGIANFTPIGSPNGEFSGQFNGQHHIIRNLTITSDMSSNAEIGLFAVVSGSVWNLGIVNAKVVVTWAATDDNTYSIDVGILAGDVGDNGSVRTSYSTGSVTVTGHRQDPDSIGEVRAQIGGLVGSVSSFVNSPGVVFDSWSSAAVTAGGDPFVVLPTVGGLVGSNTGGRTTNSFATGAVTCGNTDSCVAGGLEGNNFDGVVKQSFATGPVTAGTNSLAGGLIGWGDFSTIQQSYASGPVFGGAGSKLGGLAASFDNDNGAPSSSISQSYAVGPLRGTCSACGGLVAEQSGPVAITNSYWDKNTTGQATSAGGTGETTAQLQAALPASFSTPPWGITKGVSYPYSFTGSPAFASMLATTVANSRVFTFLPIDQHEPSEYVQSPAKGGALASLATVYTMIARAIGITDNVAALKGVKIDTYFWNNTTQTSSWTGPVTHYATLGTFADIGSATDLSSVIGQINHRKPVILRGTYTGSKAFHYMLATLCTTDANNVVTSVITNDPLTGQQVKIDPVTKHVTSPANYPLLNFTVTGYQPVSLL